ncbi:hypothetical protein COO60DRAFT_1646504 [Scenedesmus sp. NREL 46B-D3]|nr:hypothetical protein COO60DRAFT_1646504 [Scenedesmus sp. NREL 46B-D3]
MAASSTAAAAGATVDLSDVGDPTISMLWRRIYAHLSSTQVPPLVTRIKLSTRWRSVSRNAAQQGLQHIAATFTQLQELDMSAELESLSLKSCGRLRSFRLELPELQRLLCEHVELRDGRGFGSSLSSCPKLETVDCYKLLGLRGACDDLQGIKLWAPKLAELELRACYSLDCVRIMDDPTGTPPTPLRVNLINASIDVVSKRHLKQHPRVTAPGGKLITRPPRQRELDLSALWENEVEVDDDDDDDDDDEDEDEGFGGGAGFGFWPVGGLDDGMMAGGGGGGAGFVPGMRKWMTGEGSRMGRDGEGSGDTPTVTGGDGGAGREGERLCDFIGEVD